MTTEASIAEDSAVLREWRLDIPGARPILTPNQQRGTHWSVTDKAAEQVAELVTEWLEPLKDRLPPITGPVSAYIIWRAPDNVVRDSDSLSTWGKAAQDALVKAGILSDDNHKIVCDTAYRIDVDPARTGMTIMLIPNPARAPLVPATALIDALTPSAAPVVEQPAAPTSLTKPAVSESKRRSLRAVPPLPQTSESATRARDDRPNRTSEPSILILNGDRPKMPRSEKEVISWLRELGSVSGVAISGCLVPRDDREDISCEADLLLFTPHGCVVLEAKSPQPGDGGNLPCLANDRWRFDGSSEDALLVSGKHTNPLDQVRRPVFGLKNLIEHLTQREDVFVSGVVIVVPNGAPITLKKPAILPDGFDVWLGEGPTQLLADLNRTLERRYSVWDAEMVLGVLHALEITSITLDDLRKRGFPADRSAAVSKSTALAVRPAVEIVPVTPPGLPMAPPPPSLAVIDSHLDSRVVSARPNLHIGSRTITAGALAVVAGCVLWSMLTQNSDAPAPADPGHSQVTPTVSTPKVPDNYQVPKACYPFQTGC
ncbi:NERD domain-containing protein [Nocardia sp. NPDC049220]|uniref:NERD domain-containing protein n=1 Tax=Nocardia sp. NPDC049220 TaxID=3155273 RepID=UPI0033F72880